MAKKEFIKEDKDIVSLISKKNIITSNFDNVSVGRNMKEEETKQVIINRNLNFRETLEKGAGKPEEGATNSKTFAQDDAPTGGFKPGDLWFDTNDSNKLYRADETLTWVFMQ